MSRFFERLWWRRDEPAWTEAWAWPLSLAALAFRAGAALRPNQPARARVPVIAVGNLGVGGAGKTPVALELCERLRARGERPALLSRGYGRTSRGGLVRVSAGQGALVDAGAGGDEPVLAAKRLPWLIVLAGPDRARLAEEAASLGATALVLDDGLQQRRLACDLTVIVLDARNPLGNQRRLPRGPLREGLEAFTRVGGRGLLWLSNAGGDRAGSEREGGDERAGELEEILARGRRAGLRGPVESRVTAALPEGLRGGPIFLLAGIARPERFEATARALGLEIRGARLFADHHLFTPRQLEEVRRAALGAGARAIVTTEKDAARMGEAIRAGEPPMVPLPISLELLAGSDALERALDSLFANRAGASR